MSTDRICIPKSYDFGAGRLTELSYLQTTLGVPRRTALKWLRALHIEPVYIRDEVYFNIDTFNRILYVLTRPGAKGFAFPGTRARKGVMKEVTQEIIDEANDPRTMAMMEVASSRSTAVIRKLLDCDTKAKKSNG